MGTTVLLLFWILRSFYLIYKIKSGATKFAKCKRRLPVKTLICIGSGGHTSEIIKLIQNLDPLRYKPRYYLMANNDIVSETKILDLERNIFQNRDKYGFNIEKIPRSRIVGQSYFTSIFTTLNSILHCIPILINIKPDLIICNGPGTCIPICFIAFVMRIFFLCPTRIVFIESICRVESFSLSGRILMHFADNIIVHWKELTRICKRADYLGQLF